MLPLQADSKYMQIKNGKEVMGMPGIKDACFNLFFVSTIKICLKKLFLNDLI